MSKPLPWVEKLSQGIVELVRRLESRGEPITVESVAYMLDNDPSLLPDLSKVTNSNQVPSVRSSHIRLVQELEEEHQKMVELFQSALVTLSPFLNFSGASKISKKFESFKEKLRDGASLDQIDEAFNTFKEAVLQYGLEPTGEKKGAKKTLRISSQRFPQQSRRT